MSRDASPPPMPDTAPRLRLASGAALSVAGRAVALPAPRPAADTAMRRIAARPAAQAAAGIASAIAEGASFGVFDAEAPPTAPMAGGSGPVIDCATSGSSAAPKIVRRTHGSWTASFDVDAEIWDLGPSDRFAVLGELHHSLALYGLALGLWLGAAVKVLSGLRPDRQWRGLREFGASVIHATPVQIRQLHGARGDAAGLGPMRLVLIGGGALDPGTRAMARELFPQARIAVFYGASETSFITLSGPDTPEGSVGRPYPGVELRLLTPEGHPAAEGETGEIFVRSPYLFVGYAYGNQPETVWHEGFLSVGELGRLDTAGNLTLMGRKSRMFTCADRNVFPEAVERWLLSQPGIAQAAVLPRADARRGAVPVAFVATELELRELEALLARARRALGPAAPRAVTRVADWPLLSSGKTDYRALAPLAERAG